MSPVLPAAMSSGSTTECGIEGAGEGTVNKPGAGVPWDPGAGGTPRAGVISAGLRVTVGRREAVPRSLRQVEARVGVPEGCEGTEAG